MRRSLLRLRTYLSHPLQDAPPEGAPRRGLLAAIALSVAAGFAAPSPAAAVPGPTFSVPARARLTQNLTYYVNPNSGTPVTLPGLPAWGTGSDTNNGLSPASPFATASAAAALASTTWDVNGFQLSIQLAYGTDGAPVTHPFIKLGNIVGPMNTDPGLVVNQQPQSTFTCPQVIGNPTDPASCIVGASAQSAVIFPARQAIQPWFLQGFTMTSTGLHGMQLDWGTWAYVGNVIFGAVNSTNGSHVNAIWYSRVEFLRSMGYGISGGGANHANAQYGAVILHQGGTVNTTITNTPNFTGGFASAWYDAIVNFTNCPGYTGTATGQRWVCADGIVMAPGANGTVLYSDLIGLPGSLPGVNYSRSPIAYKSPQTYYVSESSGNNSWNGLSASSGATTGNGPFATLQYAISYINSTWAGNNQTITLQLLDGNFTGSAVHTVNNNLKLVIQGNATTPGAVTWIGATSQPALNVSGAGVNATVQYITMGNSASGQCLSATLSGVITLGPGMIFNQITGFHMRAIQDGIIQPSNSYSIAGGCNSHFQVTSQSVVAFPGNITITFIGAANTITITNGIINGSNSGFATVAAGITFANPGALVTTSKQYTLTGISGLNGVSNLPATPTYMAAGTKDATSYSA